MQQIDISRIDLNLLVVFEAVWIERHVGRAAARLHLSQSATSHALSRLRSLFGDALFTRHPGGVEPTPRATALAVPVQQALGNIRTLVAPTAPFNPRESRATWRIGASDHAFVASLLSAVRTLQDCAPKVNLRILPANRHSALESFDRGQLDFALGSYPDVPARIDRHTLFDDRYLGVVRAGHPLLDQDLSRIETIAAAQFAMVSMRGDAEGPFDEVLAALGLARRVMLTVPHFFVLPFVLAESELVALLPEKVAVKMAQHVGLQSFELPVQVPPLATHLLCVRARRGEPALEWMRGVLIKAAAPPANEAS